jgi:hypothetical protein
VEDKTKQKSHFLEKKLNIPEMMKIKIRKNIQNIKSEDNKDFDRILCSMALEV